MDSIEVSNTKIKIVIMYQVLICQMKYEELDMV